MSYLDRDTYGMYKNYGNGPGPRLLGADTIIGEDVYNHQDEDLGDIKDILLDVHSGQVAYAVLSFQGMADKLFAVPWSALELDSENKRFILNIEKELLEYAPGFDKDNWPDMTDPTWQNTINSYYANPRKRSDIKGNLEGDVGIHAPGLEDKFTNT